MLNFFRQFFIGHRFRIEISTIIVVKLLLLMILWWLCFSHHGSMTPERVTQHFMSPGSDQ